MHSLARRSASVTLSNPRAVDDHGARCPILRSSLKPVHRRLLYAMRQLRLDPNSAFQEARAWWAA